MTPIPPAAVLFLLQSGYSATLVMQIAVDSINGVANESRRAGMTRPGDPEFTRLAQLLYELQLANALQIRIERSKDNSETAVIGFPPTNVGPDVVAKTAEMQAHPAPGRTRPEPTRFATAAGPERRTKIAIVTRSMLQVMLELGILAQVPESRYRRRQSNARRRQRPIARCRTAAPPEHQERSMRRRPKSYVAIQYKGRWFWIGDDDIRSKSIFTSVMLLFSISDVGVRSAPPVVTVPAN